MLFTSRVSAFERHKGLHDAVLRHYVSRCSFLARFRPMLAHSFSPSTLGGQTRKARSRPETTARGNSAVKSVRPKAQRKRQGEERDGAPTSTLRERARSSSRTAWLNSTRRS